MKADKLIHSAAISIGAARERVNCWNVPKPATNAPPVAIALAR